jgi:uncharacterized protein (DUF488 family)
MKFYTIGYGGKARLGIWVKAKTPDKGIEKFLAGAGIGYAPLIELGNIFREYPDWETRYKALLVQAGDLLFERLAGVTQPFCLMCAEKRVADCHRRLIAEYLVVKKGGEVEHIE